jgi:pyruvate dehydrogenase (quinone)
MGKRVADVLVETLQTADVKTCYGIVGDTLNRIAHAIDRSEIDWVHVRHEEAGAFAAAAEALFTGRLTACAGRPWRIRLAARTSSNTTIHTMSA